MKGCFKFIVIGFLILCALSLGRFYLYLTPEQRAAEQAKWQEERRASEAEAKAQSEASQRQRERVDALKPEFITWLQRNAGVETARFKEGILGDALEVKFSHGWTSKDEARVKAEALAKAWRLRSGLDYAECAIYWGNEIYATGVSP
jgi:hypothetical protein